MQSKQIKLAVVKPLLIISTLFLVLLFSSCKNKTTPLINNKEAGLPEDFIQFYDKFHSDSAYQMSHIQFPLEGYPTNADSITGQFFWTPDKWKMHTMKAFNDSLFTRKFEVPMPFAVNETVFQNNTPFGMMRRFFKKGDEWYLIFYSDMNAMKQ